MQSEVAPMTNQKYMIDNPAQHPPCDPKRLELLCVFGSEVESLHSLEINQTYQLLYVQLCKTLPNAWKLSLNRVSELLALWKELGREHPVTLRLDLESGRRRCSADLGELLEWSWNMQEHRVELEAAWQSFVELLREDDKQLKEGKAA
jgi:hypothetical protein